jgi:outer membrane protein
MNRFNLKNLFLGIFFLGSTFLVAQSKIFTLNEVVRMGLENSKQLQNSATKIKITQAKTKQIWNAQIPTVTLSSAYTRISDNIEPFKIKFPNGGEQILNPQILNQFSNRISVQQYLFTGMRANNFWQQSHEFLEKAVTFDFEKDKIEIKNNIIAAVFNLYKLQQAIKSLNENSKVLKNRQTDAKNFVAQGTSLENDLLKVDLALTQLEVSQQELVNGISAAEFALRILLGLPENTDFSLDEKSLFENHETGNLDAYLASATALRPDLAAVEQRRLAAEKQLLISKGAYFPTLAAVVNGYYNNPNQRVFPQQDAFKGTWEAGLQLQWNLTSLYTNKFQVQEAKVGTAQSQLLKEQLIDAAKIEVSTNFYAYKTAQAKIALSEKSIIQSIENQRITKNRYNAQLATVTELLEADFLLFQNQINAINAKSDSEAAYYKLMKAVGK